MTLSIPRSFLWFSAVPNTLFSSKSRFPIPIWDLWIIYGTWYWRTGWRKCTRYNVLKAKFLVVIRSVRGSGSGPPISLPWTRTGVPVLEDVVESIFSYRYAIVIVPRKNQTNQSNKPMESVFTTKKKKKKKKTTNEKLPQTPFRTTIHWIATSKRQTREIELILRSRRYHPLLFEN